SVTIVVAQELISKNSAVASGLMLGFGIGTGGLGVGLVGLLAEYRGIVFVINLLVLLPLLAGLLGLAIRGKPAKQAVQAGRNL
ncbi:MAG: MFS transporter, partial [Desulfocucumaceae bacterium]